MAAFRFRAQAALDLRRREDDDASRALSRSEQQLSVALRGLEEADQRLVHAYGMAHEGMPPPDRVIDRDWYRFWIVRLEQERAARRREVATCREAFEAARERRRNTWQRVEALERFKEKALDAHERARLREEQKQSDEFGTLRYVAQRRAV